MAIEVKEVKEEEDSGPSGILGHVKDGLSKAATLYKLLGIGLLTAIVVMFLAYLMSTRTATARESLDLNDLQQEMPVEEVQVSSEEHDLWYGVITLVDAMAYMDKPFEMTGAEAQEFGASFFPANYGIRFISVRFEYDSRTVTIHYDTDDNKDVRLTCAPNRITKIVEKRKGFSEGDLLGFVRWYAYGRYARGYPCYVYEVDTGGPNGVWQPRISRYYVRYTPFGMVMKMFT